jgi:hypothetical protein
LILEEIDVLEAYGLAQSFHPGPMTEAQNQGVDMVAIDYINWWDKKGKALDKPYFSGNMRVHYSNMQMMMKTFLQFFLALKDMLQMSYGVSRLVWVAVKWCEELQMRLGGGGFPLW